MVSINCVVYGRMGNYTYYMVKIPGIIFHSEKQGHGKSQISLVKRIE